MNNNKLILSICIPTYNRCEILDNTLSNLFSNPEFDSNLIEVIVSDNCSTDHTGEVVNKYPLVRYYRNSKNIKDYNFSTALSLAKAKYIRLFNDTLSFKKGALGDMLNKIKEHSFGNYNLFFYSNMFANNNCLSIIDSRINFIKEVSFYSTWNSNFGCWRKDFDKIIDKNRYAELQFVQVDWSYRIVNNYSKTLIYFNDNFYVENVKNKGGYNLFDTFVNKYLYIIKNENFTFLIYELEKYRLCRYFIYHWLIALLIEDKENYSFETKNVFKILFSKYWYEPYFYFILIIFAVKKVKHEIYN